MDVQRSRELLGGTRQHGVLYGLTYRDPQSATLTALYEGGVVRLAPTTLGGEYREFVIQPGSKAFTASKDTYVYISGTDGSLSYYEVDNDDPKPKLTDLADDSIFIAKVVTDGSRVVSGGVTDLRALVPSELEIKTVEVSFTSTETGAHDIGPMPYPGRVLYLSTSVSDALAATDNGTVALAIVSPSNVAGSTATNGTVTIAASAAVGDMDETAPSAGRDFVAGSRIRLTSAKTTSGGRAHVNVVIQKLAR